MVILSGIVYGRPWKGYRFHPGIGIYDTIGASSEAMNLLIVNSKGFNLKKKAKFGNLNERGKFEDFTLLKGEKSNMYLERIYENQINAYARDILPD